MTDVSRMVELYKIRIENRSQTVYTANQRQAIIEALEFVKQFDSVEEATVQLRKTNHYVAEATAVYLDELEARRMAAWDRNEPEVVAIYQDRIEQVKADPMSQYNVDDTFTKVKSARIKRQKIQEGLFQIYTGYLKAITETFGTDPYKEGVEELVKGANVLQMEGVDFVSVAKDPYYRRLIPIGDRVYEKFLANVPAILQGKDVTFGPPKEIIEDEARGMWELVKANKDVVTQVGARELPKYKRGRCLVVPPPDSNGKYDFIEIEEEEGW